MSTTATHRSNSNFHTWTQLWDESKKSWFLLLDERVAFRNTSKNIVRVKYQKYARRIYVEQLTERNPNVTAANFTYHAQCMLEVHPQQPDSKDPVIAGHGRPCIKVRWRELERRDYVRTSPPAAAPPEVRRQDPSTELKILDPRAGHYQQHLREGLESGLPTNVQQTGSIAPLPEQARGQQTSDSARSGSRAPAPPHLDHLRPVRGSRFSWVYGGRDLRTAQWHLHYDGKPAYTRLDSPGNCGRRITPNFVEAKLRKDGNGRIDMAGLEKTLLPCDVSPNRITVPGVPAVRMRWTGAGGRPRFRCPPQSPEVSQTSASSSQLSGQGVTSGKRAGVSTSQPVQSGLPLPFAPGFKPHDWVLKAMEDRRDYPGTLGK